MISKVSTFLGPNGLYQGISGTPSLVLSLDASNVLSYSGTGLTWSDLSIRKNNGILNGVSSVTGSIPSTSLSFNGTGSYISFTQSNGIPSGNSQYTIEAWFNSNSYDVFEQGAIIGWGSVGDDNMSNVLRLSANGLTNYWWNNDITFSLSGTSSMIVGNWYYAVATYDGTNRKLFLNGELKSTDTPGAHSVSDTSTLKVGHFYNSYFDGKISKIRVSDKAISGSRVLSNFNSSKIDYGYTFGSMTFNDTDSYLISTSNDYVLGTNDFTVEAFFKASTASNAYTGIVSQRQIGNYNVSINLQNANTSEPLIEFTSGVVSSTYTASNSVWYHVSISRTGGTSSYFINGNLVNEVADTTDYTISDLVVGRYYTEYSDYYFNGIISNVRVINGTGLYTGTFSPPSVQLSGTESNTKFLITSQEMNPTADLGGLHSVTPSNIGWTSSLPVFIPPYDIYFDASNISSYSGTGTTLNSIGASGSVPGLIGTMTNVSFISGTAGGVLNFDGSSSISFDQYDFGDTITLNAWVYPRNRPSINTLMCNTSSGLSSNGFKLEWNSWTTTDLKMIIENGNGSSGTGRATDNAVITENSWQMLTYVVDFVNQTGKLYVNGVEQSSNGAIVANVSRNNSWYIGSMFGAYQMDAYLGEFKVWKSLQSDSEISSEFNSSKSRYGL